MNIFGPFSQIVTMQGLGLNGILNDNQLKIIDDGAVLIDGDKIAGIGKFKQLSKEKGAEIHEIKGPAVLLPGFIDAHTHICHAGTRFKDYALRVAGFSYLNIAKQGGGILDTVKKTRAASKEELVKSLMQRCDTQLKQGVTTCEVKSGYGLNIADELKMLEVIQKVDKGHAIDLVSSCLAAHVKPKEFKTHQGYLQFIVKELLPIVKQKKLSRRVDIFVEEGAFSDKLAKEYIREAQKLDFMIVVHADQFSVLGSKLACEMRVLSADHLEASGLKEIKALAKTNVIATVLPGASLGLGMSFAPARKLLDQGCSVVIASDWNPGSAPMGNLLMQAAVLGASEKLTMTETFAGITFRAAKALSLDDRGVLEKGKLADMIAFPCKDYRDILYHQGQMLPNQIWKRGMEII